VETGCVAVGELAMHGREYAVVIRPGSRGLVLHTLFFANEVRMEEEPAADLGLVAGKELELAKMLVEAQRAPFDAAKLKDKFQERVLDLVEKRAATAVPGVRSGGLPKQQEPAADLMDALRKSLEAARKPAQSETSGRAPRKKEKRGAK